MYVTMAASCWPSSLPEEAGTEVFTTKNNNS